MCLKGKCTNVINWHPFSYSSCIVLRRCQYLRVYSADSRISGEYDSGRLWPQGVVAWSESHSDIHLGDLKIITESPHSGQPMSSPGIDTVPSPVQIHPFLVLRQFVLSHFVLTCLANLRHFLICFSYFGFKALMLVYLHLFVFCIWEYFLFRPFLFTYAFSETQLGHETRDGCVLLLLQQYSPSLACNNH